MAATEPLFHLFEIDPSKFSKQELILLEAELFARIREELKEFFRKQHQNYFQVMKFSIEKENLMLDTNNTRLILKDILSTQEYTLEGIACYTDTPDDVVYELVAGINTKPVADFLYKLIKLHQSVRPDLYKSIIKKIFTDLAVV